MASARGERRAAQPSGRPQEPPGDRRPQMDGHPRRAARRGGTELGLQTALADTLPISGYQSEWRRASGSLFGCGCTTWRLPSETSSDRSRSTLDTSVSIRHRSQVPGWRDHREGHARLRPCVGPGRHSCARPGVSAFRVRDGRAGGRTGAQGPPSSGGRRARRGRRGQRLRRVQVPGPRSARRRGVLGAGLGPAPARLAVAKQLRSPREGVERRASPRPAGRCGVPRRRCRSASPSRGRRGGWAPSGRGTGTPRRRRDPSLIRR